MAKGSIKTLRVMNQGLVLQLIRSGGPISRADISKRTGLTRSAVSAIVSKLVAEGAVLAVGIGSNWTGRKPVLYEYNARSGFVLGLDIGGTNISCAAADMVGVIVARHRFQTPAALSRHELLACLFTEMQRFCDQAELSLADLKAVGVASPGVIDHVAGRVVGAAPDLPDWEDLPLAQLIQDRLGVPVLIDNDVHLALLGEVRRGAAEGCRNAAFINVSTGLGGALMLDGRLHRGPRNFGGEIGYWLVGTEHLHHDWGVRGCLETMTSGRGIAERARAGLRSFPQSLLADPAVKITAETIFECARSGDPLAHQIVQETADYLGFTVVNLASLLDLEVVILGGGVMRSADLLLSKVQEYADRHTPVPVAVTVSRFPDEASLLGAIDLVLDSIR
ncbi:MAG: xylR [Firmicutes bacterium]|nr:xylR [Bacillota bacterium]